MSLTSRRTAMARKRYKPEEIVAKLRQVDVLVSQGQNMVDAIRQIGVSEVTYYRWRQEFGGLKIEQVSNCVVGSGGSWLPCSTIAEHSVEGCDHFSHDGDDDDLGFFVGGGEAFVEGFEGGTVTACAEGGHVEDVTDRHPTTIDAAVSLELAAVEVIGCE